ncbi:hypothetical protein ACO0KY_16130 [Undibacterium sp. Dicai25W]|uniref:hypothetical protein n=1 Tax=Undibacterium sp. Dicai25W TaxID=3413034 RepID=UPI003BF0AD5A
MKTSIKTSAVLATALFASVLAVGNAFTAQTNPTLSQKAEIPTVVITAQRMTEDQKIAFDTKQSDVQTVIISAKRLTDEQKLAMDQDPQYASQIATRNNRRAAI